MWCMRRDVSRKKREAEREKWREEERGGGEKKREGAKCLVYRGRSLSGEGQPSSWVEKFKVVGRVCQVGTEGCWENLEARSAVVC